MRLLECLAVIAASLVLGMASYQYGKAVGFWEGYDYVLSLRSEHVLTLLGFGPDFESKGDEE